MGLIWYHRLLGLEPDAALLAGCRSQWAEFGSMEAMVGTSADGVGALGPDELTEALLLVYTAEHCLVCDVLGDPAVEPLEFGVGEVLAGIQRRSRMEPSEEGSLPGSPGQ